MNAQDDANADREAPLVQLLRAKHRLPPDLWDGLDAATKQVFLRHFLRTREDPEAALCTMEVDAYALFVPEPGTILPRVGLCRRRGPRDTVGWVVFDGTDVLNKTGEFEFEPLAFQLTSAFAERTYFSTPGDALAAWETYVKTNPTFAEAQRPTLRGIPNKPG